MKKDTTISRRSAIFGALAAVSGIGAFSTAASAHRGRAPGIAHSGSNKIRMGKLQVNRDDGFIAARAFNTSNDGISLVTVRVVIFNRNGEAAARRTKWLTPSLSAGESTLIKIDYNSPNLHDAHMTVNHIF